jgi:Flp pilus assembly protein TadB
MRAAAGLEVLTGLGLIVSPSLLARFLFGSDLNAAGEATGRLAGFVLLCLAAGCWPRAGESGRHQAFVPLVALSWLAAAFLVLTGLIGANVGLLLWPAAALHLILAVLLTRTWARRPRRHERRNEPST